MARTTAPREPPFPEWAELAEGDCALENLERPGFCIDPRGVIVCANPAATVTLQLERAELVGSPFLDRFLPEARASAQALLDRCRSEGGSVKGQLRALRRNREVFPFLAIAHAAPKGGGVVLLVGEDLSRAEVVQGHSPPENRLEQQTEACLDSLSRLTADCTKCREETTLAMTLAEERERQRIAGGLHDEVGQGLASAHLKLGALAEALPDELAAEVTKIRTQLRETLEATRSLTFRFGNPLLNTLGLEAALESLGQRLQADYGLRAEFTSEFDTARLPEVTRLILYRVLSELMYNAARHASATTLSVVVSGDEGRLIASVEDDGVGMRAAARPPPSGDGGFGLYLAEARLAGLGGCLVIDSERRRGTRIVVDVPVPGV